MGCQVCDDNFKPQFIDFDTAQGKGELHITLNVGSWMNLLSDNALGGHT
jgi:hypothetical protein